MPYPHKGVRIQATTRIPVAIHRQAAMEAARRGMTLNDFIVATLAERLDADPAANVGIRQNVAVYDDDGNKIGVV